MRDYLLEEFMKSDPLIQGGNAEAHWLCTPLSARLSDERATWPDSEGQHVAQRGNIGYQDQTTA